MWNTIFLVAVVQAHNTNPYWRSGTALTACIATYKLHQLQQLLGGACYAIL